MNIPKNHQTVMVYLILDNPEQFISFTKEVFNAELTHKGMREDGRIMHAEISVGENTIMFAQVSDQWKSMTAGIFVYVPSADKAFDIAIKNGATVITELTDQPYGRTCGVKDTNGNVWWMTEAIVRSK
ncbi:VOC family protein [Pollutibacter soli]|uniref:VOC family protein n=1 Tax=Pollutibacter soli TaxID=3034157 RepID=UPI0030137E3D